MSFKYEKALQLREEGLAYGEIGEVLGVKPLTAKSYVYSARHRQRYLEKQRRLNQRYYWKHKQELSIRRKGVYELNLNEMRKTRLNTRNGTLYNLNKRPYPDTCELCGRADYKLHPNPRYRSLHYHHWDDRKPNLGMWVCRACHRAITFFIENGLVERYYQIKKNINEVEKFAEVRPKTLREAWYI